MRYRLAAVMLVVIVASGCSTSNTGPQGQNPDDGAGTGGFNLYISDQPADIDSFEYLNVTVSEVRVFKESSESDEATSNRTNATNQSEEGFESFSISETVDLTRLKGDNATSILETDLEAGNYTKIELEASGIDATVDGSQVEVKLPSEKLQLTKSFTISANQTTEFVFDIHVVQRGNQGYVLRPVISQSGTAGEEVEINRKERDSRPDGEGSESPAGGPPGNVPA